MEQRRHPGAWAAAGVPAGYVAGAGEGRGIVLLRAGGHPALDGAPGGPGGDRRGALPGPRGASWRRWRPRTSRIPRSCWASCSRGWRRSWRCWPAPAGGLAGGAAGRHRRRGARGALRRLGGGRGARLRAGAVDLGRGRQDRRGRHGRAGVHDLLAAEPAALGRHLAGLWPACAAGVVLRDQSVRAGVCPVYMAGPLRPARGRDLRGRGPGDLGRIARHDDRPAAPVRAAGGGRPPQAEAPGPGPEAAVAPRGVGGDPAMAGAAAGAVARRQPGALARVAPVAAVADGADPLGALLARRGRRDGDRHPRRVRLRDRQP